MLGTFPFTLARELADGQRRRLTHRRRTGLACVPVPLLPRGRFVLCGLGHGPKHRAAERERDTAEGLRERRGTREDRARARPRRRAPRTVGTVRPRGRRRESRPGRDRAVTMILGRNPSSADLAGRCARSLPLARGAEGQCRSPKNFPRWVAPCCFGKSKTVCGRSARPDWGIAGWLVGECPQTVSRPGGGRPPGESFAASADHPWGC